MPHLAGHFKIKNRNIKKRIIRKQQRSAKGKKAQTTESQIQKAAVSTYVMEGNQGTADCKGYRYTSGESIEKTLKGNIEKV